jgi:hypothetical protein
MRNRLAVILLANILCVSFSTAQQKCTVTGTVFDKETLKPVGSVDVIIRGEKIGTATDTTGRFSLQLSLHQKYLLVFCHIGYEKLTREIFFDRVKEVELRIPFQSQPIKLPEFVVTGSKRAPISVAAFNSAIYRASGSDFERLGEKDLQRAFEYLFPDIIKRREERMMMQKQVSEAPGEFDLFKGKKKFADSPSDFALYVNGDWKESIFLDEIDPFTIKRVLIWDTDPFFSPISNVAPAGLALRRGSKYVILIETN